VLIGRLLFITMSNPTRVLYFVCGLIALPLSSVALGAASDDNGIGMRHLAYCLSDDNLEALAAASLAYEAEANDLDFSPLSKWSGPDEWLSESPTSLANACELITQQRPSTIARFFGELSALTPVLAGTGLGLLASSYGEHRVARRQQLAEVVNRADEFRRLAQRHSQQMMEPGASLDRRSVEDALDALEAGLVGLSVNGVRVVQANHALDGLRASPVRELLRDNWGGSPEQRQSKRQEFDEQRDLIFGSALAATGARWLRRGW
jgi:hypothetical protein